MSNGLRFDIYERVHLPENVAAIDELEEIELVPRIQVIDQGENAVLQGQLVLNGIYRAQGAGDEQVALEHWIPVEITLPMNRVTKLDEITVDIDTFDVVLLSSRALNLTGILSLRGITLEQEEESDSWNVEAFTASHSRGEEEDGREENAQAQEAEQQFNYAQQYEAVHQYEAAQQYGEAEQIQEEREYEAQQTEGAEQYTEAHQYETFQQYEAVQQHEAADQNEDARQYAAENYYEAAQQYEAASPYESAEQQVEAYYAAAEHSGEGMQQHEGEQQEEARYTYPYEQPYRVEEQTEEAPQEQYTYPEASLYHNQIEAAPEEQIDAAQQDQSRPDLNSYNWEQSTADQLSSYVQFIEQKYAPAPEQAVTNEDHWSFARVVEQQEANINQASEEQVVEEAEEQFSYQAEQASQFTHNEQSASEAREEETALQEEITANNSDLAQDSEKQDSAEQWSAWEPVASVERAQAEEDQAEESEEQSEADQEQNDNEQQEEERAEEVEEANEQVSEQVTEPPATRELHIALNGNKEENETQGIRTILNSSLREQAAQQAANLQKQEEDRQQAEAAAQQAADDEVQWKQLFISKRPEQNEFKRIRMIIVQKDDTLEQIATRYNISARDILVRNNLHESAITAGQLLYIPS